MTEPIIEEFYEALQRLEEEYGYTTLDSLVRQTQEKGYLINNLFQLDQSTWRASLMKPKLEEEKEDFYEYGEGNTPEEALQNAIHNAFLMSNRSYMAARRKLRRPT